MQESPIVAALLFTKIRRDVRRAESIAMLYLIKTKKMNKAELIAHERAEAKANAIKNHNEKLLKHLEKKHNGN